MVKGLVKIAFAAVAVPAALMSVAVVLMVICM